MTKTLQILLALVPLLLTPVLGYALAEGLLNLGGGEKDILWAAIWAQWSIFFAVCAIVLIFRNWQPARWAVRSAFVATGIMALFFVALYFANVLGVA